MENLAAGNIAGQALFTALSAASPNISSGLLFLWEFE